MENSALQVVVTILGILSQFVVLLRELSKREEEKDPRPDRPLPLPGQGTPFQPAGQRARSFLDLGFVLLCAALFSLLLTDSLVISGRAPSPGPLTILAVLAITASVCAVMYTAWRLDRSEMTAGFLALITLCVLVISPGGPFGAPSVAKDAEQGLTLYVPVLSLVALASMTLISAFGNPLSATEPRRKRLLVGQLLAVILAFSAVALGQHLVRQVMSNENAPRIETADARAVLREAGRWTPTRRRQFYQLASEIVLARRYQVDYQEIRSVQTRLLADPANASPVGSRRSSGEHTMQRAGNERLRVLAEQFHEMSAINQEKFLIDRLDWIHPVGNRNTQVTQPLLGLTVEARADRLGDLRLQQLLSDNLPLLASLKEEFPNAYPPSLNVSVDLENPLTSRNVKLSSMVKELVASRRDAAQFTLFPAADSAEYGPRQRMQLSLPLKIEEFLAFDGYGQLALRLVKAKHDNPQDNARYDQITAAFAQLTDASQSALWFYVANDSAPQAVLASLVKLSAAGVSFSALAENSTSAVYTLKAYLDARMSNTGAALTPTDADDPLKVLAYDILAKTDRDTAVTVSRLLGRDERWVPVRELFQPPVITLVKRVSELTEDARKAFIAAIADPVWPAVQQMAKTVTADSSPDLFAPTLEIFHDKLTPFEQENVLHQMAIGIYLSGGPFSLSPLSLIVLLAKGFNDTAGLLVAAAALLPLLLSCVLAGAYGARKLAARERTRKLVAEEQQNLPDASVTTAQPVDLFGRAEVLSNLRGLAERGWSTIGVVGRRGVGKSRILVALLQPRPQDADRLESSTVKVWVASPSRFQEEEFIASIFERLAMSTESAIASFLGAQPLAVRQLEDRSNRAGLRTYAAALGVLLLIVYQMYDRLTRADIVMTWVPIATLLFVSLLVVMYHASTLQPVDLSSWLQRDRAHNPHTVMLYREVNEALLFLRDRARLSRDPDAKRQTLNSVRGFLMKSSFLACVTTLLFSIPGSDGPSYTGLALALGLGALFLMLYQQQDDARVMRHGDSTMSLIAEYRAFATNIVTRLNRGALGHPADRKFAVLVCIDELDKIVDFEEIRGFVRRIKAIFEVPGVYYYVSLAEDTLTSLYLGAATGKNEIDSAFDHVVRIPPVTCDEGEKIATDYLTKHDAGAVHPRLARTIATVSYGIPRDIIRRCDEYLARPDLRKLQPGDRVREQRQAQAAFGYELRQLSSAHLTEFSQDPTTAVTAAARWSKEIGHGEPEAQQRLVLGLWLLALIEAAIEIPDDPQWHVMSNMLCQTGYKTPIEPIADVRREVERMQIALWPAVIAEVSGPALAAGAH